MKSIQGEAQTSDDLLPPDFQPLGLGHIKPLGWLRYSLCCFLFSVGVDFQFFLVPVSNLECCIDEKKSIANSS
jgi:hypothetical protein